MTKTLKFFIKLGGVADALFCIFLTVKLIISFATGEEFTGIAYAITLALWCISCSIVNIIEELRKLNKSEPDV